MTRKPLAALLMLVGGLVLVAGTSAPDIPFTIPRLPRLPSLASDDQLDQKKLLACCLRVVAADLNRGEWHYVSQVYDFWEATTQRAFRDIDPTPHVNTVIDQVGVEVAELLPEGETSAELTGELRDQIAAIFRRHAAEL